MKDDAIWVDRPQPYQGFVHGRYIYPATGKVTEGWLEADGLKNELKGRYKNVTACIYNGVLQSQFIPQLRNLFAPLLLQNRFLMCGFALQIRRQFSSSVISAASESSSSLTGTDCSGAAGNSLLPVPESAFRARIAS